MRRFEFESLNVNECLRNYQVTTKFLEERKFNDAFHYYITHYKNITCRGVLEWQMADGLLENDSLEAMPDALPRDIERRFSGAALIFVASQVANANINLPIILFSTPVLEPERKLVLAEALSKFPNFPCPSGNDGFEKFVNWLCDERDAIAPCLFAATQRESTRKEYLEELARLWLQKGLNRPKSLPYLIKSSRVPLLKQIVCDAVTRCLSMYWGDNKILLQLENAAFRLEHYRAVIAYSDILLNRRLTDEDRQQNLALRIISLAEVGFFDEAVLEYSRFWIPNGWVFPYPERLLYPLQYIGARIEEEHLLRSIPKEQTVPMWILLNRERIFSRSSKGLLDKWAQLYRKDRQDETVLVGLSLTLMELPDIQRDQSLCGLVLEHWKLLYNYESYKTLAGAFLVLIANSHQDRISAFEKYMHLMPLSNFLARKASHVYLRALMARKRWKELFIFLKNVDNNQLKAVCNYEEFEFIKLMADFESSLPKDKADINRWCENWERLLSFPLTSHMLLQALELFLILKEQLGTGEYNLKSHELFVDLEYQFLRRVKAEAESVLKHPGVPATERVKRCEQIRDASLEASYNILNQIGILS